MLDGTAILATASTGGVVLVERKTGRALFWAHIAMAHSAELLPGRCVVVAASLSPQGDRLEVYDLDRSGQVVDASELHADHGVVWDDKRKRLYALGIDAIRAYTLRDWDGLQPRLEQARSWRLPSQGDGHDLSRDPATGALIVSTAENFWRFDSGSDSDNGNYSVFAPLAGLTHVKAVSLHAATGRIAFLQPEESWWSHHNRLLAPNASVAVSGMQLYKVRWLLNDGGLSQSTVSACRRAGRCLSAPLERQGRTAHLCAASARHVGVCVDAVKASRTPRRRQPPHWRCRPSERCRH